MMLLLIFIFGLVTTCTAHSTMTCVSKVGSTCAIKVRQDPYYMDVAPRCCGGGAASDLVKCPAPQAAPDSAKIAAGSKFTVEWPARNHATPSQKPDAGITNGVSIYLAPSGAKTLGEYCGSTTVNKNCPNKIGEGSFGPSTCGGKNGDNVPCQIQVTMPAGKSAGKYNLLWLWDWRHNDGSMYSACGDVNVVASGTVVTSPPTPATTAPTPLPPTTSGTTRAPTDSPTAKDKEKGPTNCQEESSDPKLADTKIKFASIPKTIPWRKGWVFIQEVWFNKQSNSLAMFVIDVLDSTHQWVGKGNETIPGSMNGKTSIQIKLHRELKPGSYYFKAYYVLKSIYDQDPSSAYKHEISPTLSDYTCAGCKFYRHCGSSLYPNRKVPTNCAAKLDDTFCGKPPNPIEEFFPPTQSPSSGSNLAVSFSILISIVALFWD